MKTDVDKKSQFKMSVRSLVEFLLRSGDIDDRYGGGDSVSAMQKGAALHRRIQKLMGADYHSEVTLSYVFDFGQYELKLDGRADGIIIRDGDVTIDEIKGVYQDVIKMKEPVDVHIAQAKCYAYIYATQNALENIKVQMTYGSLDNNNDINRFTYEYSYEQISEWFLKLMESYRRWGDFTYEWGSIRDLSIADLRFPFEYRQGQKKLAGDVYRTIERKKTLFVQAPCGTGKTIATIYPAIKAIEQKLAKRIFYLTAKTAARTVAINTIRMLIQNELKLKAAEITAKDKICPLEIRSCNPTECKRAKGHFDRINDALYQLIIENELIDREKIEEYAECYNVCPFELSLDAALFADAVVGDYNYVFDPKVSLQRFFSEGKKGEYIFLVDEAHNLIERARQMYSATLVKEDFLKIKKYFKVYNGGVPSALDKCNRIMLAWKRSCDNYIKLSDIDEFVAAVMRVAYALEKFFEKKIQTDGMDEIRQFYFDVKHFLNMTECLDENYTIYCDFTDEKKFFIKLFCIDPSRLLGEREALANSSIFFSATLLPVDYYKRLLCSEKKPYAIYTQSPFDAKNRHVIIGRDVSSIYKRRSDSEYARYAGYIKDIISAKEGNYMVFGPSYVFLNSVYEKLEMKGIENAKLLLQSAHMTDAQRREFLDEFDKEREGTLVGFCVMGGVFSEGIDLVGKKLIGAVVMGVGLPMVTNERELIKAHFGEMEGFSYAYVYPGMNKVLQAAGRVIRTETDTGIVALLDERFTKGGYSRIFPREWQDISTVNQNEALSDVKGFWDKQMAFE